MFPCHPIAKVAALAGLFATVLTPCPAKGQNNDRVLTLRRTDLYRAERTFLVKAETVAPFTELRVEHCNASPTGAAGADFFPVRRPNGDTFWVPKSSVVSLPQPNSYTGSMPPLIAHQPVKTRQAWLQVSAAIDENSRLASPSPQPYLARAELWVAASNYDAAVDDLVAAMTLARRQKATNADQLDLASRMAELLSKRIQTPRPRFPGDASAHFEAGYELYHSGRLFEALPQFDAAIQLDPENKSYWYYRALTNKQLLNDLAAERDVIVAVYLERTEYGGPRRWTALFTRVQGPLRNWMESYRSGVVVKQ